MLAKIKTNSGMSMLYVLAALIVTSFLGVAFLKMSGSDKTSRALYSTSASARIAAKSGIMSAIGMLESGEPSVQNQIIIMLKEWISEATAADVSDGSRWIRWDASDPEGFVILSPNQSYKTEIIAFDHRSFNIKLRSYGIGKGGSRATMISVYNLAGLAYATKSDWGPGHGFYIEDDIKLILNAPITVNGASRFSKNNKFDANARGSVFNGSFRSQDGESDDKMQFMGSYTFKGNSYFGTRPFWEQSAVGSGHEGLITIEGKSGFPLGDSIAGGGLKILSKVDFADTSYWLGRLYPANSKPNLYHCFNDKVIKYSGDFIDNLTFYDKPLYEYDPDVVEPSDIDEEPGLTKAKMLEHLGFVENPCKINVDLDVIDPSVIIDLPAGDYSGDELQAQSDANTKWNGFTVFSTSKTIRLGEKGQVDSNFILIVRDKGIVGLSSTDKMFSVRDADQGVDGGHFTIINEAGEVRNIGGWNQFRGLIYNMSNTIHIGGSKNVSPPNFYGSIYVSGGQSIEWYPLATDMGSITYDPTVYEQLEATGLITRPGCDDGEIDETTLKIDGDRIRASLVSQSL